MSVSVKFYTFDKAHNSTKQPAGGSTVTCDIKFPCSVMSPVLRLNKGAAAIGWSYAYIADFFRYYFIADTIVDGPFVEFHLTVDAMATYKTDIGNSSQYVLRSSYAADGNINDALYPITLGVTREVEEIASTGWNVNTAAGGYWSIGVAGQGETQYYLMAALDAGIFFNYLLSDTFSTNTVDAILGDPNLTTLYPQLKMMVDPLEYITSLIWIPYSFTPTGAAVSSMRVGYINVSVTNTYLIDNPQITRTIDFGTMHRHPQQGTRGPYLNGSPYTEVELYIPGFGLIQLPASQIANAGAVKVTITIDIKTGAASADVYLERSGVYKRLNRVSTTIGLPVQLSQVRVQGPNFAGLISSSIGALASAFTGNFLGAANAISSGIEDTLKSEIPIINTIGSSGSSDTMTGNAQMIYTFHDVAPMDNTRLGRPLLQNKKLSTIPGFILCGPQIFLETDATDAEYRQIINYMTSGFYYE